METLRKPLIILSFLTLLLSLFFISSQLKPEAFRIATKPSLISKGTFGQSIAIEISYSYPETKQWISSIQNNNDILFLLQYEWLQRSNDYVKLFKDTKTITGLLIDNSQTVSSIKEHIQLYTDSFEQPPIWAACSPDPCSDQVVQFLFDQKINSVAPSIYIEQLDDFKQLKKGDIASFQIKRDAPPQEPILNRITSYPFVSIEQNILGITYGTKRYPNE